ESPTFRVERKLTDLAKRAQVINEANFVKPSELINLAVKNRQPLAEILRRQADGFQDLASLQHRLPQRRLSAPPGALVERALEIFQTLCECTRIVRICFHDRRSEHRNRRRLLNGRCCRTLLEMKAFIRL